MQDPELLLRKRSTIRDYREKYVWQKENKIYQKTLTKLMEKKNYGKN
jgi:hypothetical protein